MLQEGCCRCLLWLLQEHIAARRRVAASVADLKGFDNLQTVLVVGLVTSLLFVALAAAAMQQMQGSMQRCRNRLCV